MSAAPNLETLLAYEYHLERAFRTVLTAKGFEHVILPFDEDRNSPEAQRDAALPTPRLELLLQSGAPTGHRFPLPGVTDIRDCPFDAWTGTFVVSVITSRARNTEGQPTPRADLPARQSHNEMLGKVRFVLSSARNPFTPAVLPWHQVERMDESGVRRAADDLRGWDITDLSFALHWSVRPTAWPA